MDPALALPSYRVYRGSFLALLVGSVVAVWLLVLPPAGADQDGPPDSISGLVNTPTATATGTPTPPDDGDPEATPTPTATATPTPEATQTETPEPTPEERTYIVQAGDTLFAIAERFAAPGQDVAALANEIVAANNLPDASSLSIGDELVIPGG
ncbi:MAG: LysM peptidoglycan-binding domain-containing protein [Dehalococcoidia bacterium]|nr:LysM peptidoglycan-binding domain-containing protein [Dehalococcoidia bacterium]